MTAARDDVDAKEQAWQALFTERSVPAGAPMAQLATCFWRPDQVETLLPFAHRYVDEAVRLAGGGMLAVGALLRAMFPVVGDAELVARCRQEAAAPGMDPSVKAQLLAGGDSLDRMLRARA